MYNTTKIVSIYIAKPRKGRAGWFKELKSQENEGQGAKSKRRCGCVENNGRVQAGREGSLINRGRSQGR